MEFTDPNYLVKAPKKERTEAQKAATAKAFAALKAKREAVNAVVAEVKPELVKESKKKSPPVVKEEKEEVVVSAPIPAPASLNEEELYSKFVARMKAEMSEPVKKPKKKVVIVEDSSSSSEEEVVVRRKKAVKEVVKEIPAPPPVQKSTGSRVLDKLLFTKF